MCVSCCPSVHQNLVQVPPAGAAVKSHLWILPAGVTGTAPQLCETVFWKKTQYAVGPPRLSQTVPPAVASGVQGRPRGPKVTGDPPALPARTTTGDAGANFSRLSA